MTLRSLSLTLTLTLTLTLALAAPVTHAAVPGDAAAGQRLHAAHCAGCHDDSVYTRKDRKVRTLDELQTQLQGCSHAAKKEFTAVETQNLLRYLNERYYRFK